MRYKIRLSILFVICILAGCSLPLGNKNPNFEGNDRIDTLGLTPDFSYEVVEQFPGILINQLGYLPGESKTAILQGNNLENVFYVYNVFTGEEELKGTLRPDSLFKREEEIISGSEEPKKENYLADFSELKKPGTYYIYHPDLGYSYEFEIKQNLYDEVEKEILSLMEKEEKDTLRKVADYAEAEKKLVVKRRCIVTFIGTLVCALSIMVGYIVFPILPEDSFMRSDGLWLGIGVVGLVLLWGIVIRERIREKLKNSIQNK